MTPTKNESLPELPPAAGFIARPAFGPDGFSKPQGVSTEDAYTADQMRAYAEAAHTELQSEAEQLRLGLGHTQALLSQRNDELEAALTREAPTEGNAGDSLLIRVYRPEGYEGVHPEILLDDLRIHPDFRPEVAAQPAAQRLAQGAVWTAEMVADVHRRGDELHQRITQPPHQDRGEVDSLSALAGLLAMPSGYELAEHLPGIWHFTYPGDDGVLMASGASWNHPAIAATEAWLDAALTEAKQQGPGEAVCRACNGVGEVEGLIPHASGDPQDDSWGATPCATCNGTGEPAHG